MDLEKKEYVDLTTEPANEISSAQVEKLLLKTVKYLPDNPSDSGMRANATKPKFYQFATDNEDSLVAYFNNAVASINDTIKKIVDKINDSFNEQKDQENKIIDNIEQIEKNASQTENTLTKEIEDRKQAILNLIANATEEYNTLKKIETKIKDVVGQESDQTATTLKGLANLLENEVETRKQEDQSNLSEAKSYTDQQVQKEKQDRQTEASENLISAKQHASELVSVEKQERNLAIDQAIENLVNGSQSSLDTLKELAEALGNDPNFSTTIINLINQKKDESTAYTQQQILFEKDAREQADQALKGTNDDQTLDTILGLKNNLLLETENRQDKLDELKQELLLKINALVGTEGTPTTIEGAIVSANNYTDQKIEQSNDYTDDSVSQAISDLIDGTSLDTLKKLALAINEDADFATTIQTLITQKYNESIAYTTQKTDQEATARSSADAALQNSVNATNVQVTEIKAALQTIQNVLETDITDYDTLQEIANFLKNNENAIEAIMGHINSTSNPHQVSKAQVGLSNVDNVKQYSQNNPAPKISIGERKTVLGSLELESETGLFVRKVYENNYPLSFGNVISIRGEGSTQLLLTWPGESGVHSPIYYRTKRDTDDAPWSDWYILYSSGNKPTPQDIGALPTSGGTISGDLNVTGAIKLQSDGINGPSRLEVGDDCYLKDVQAEAVGIISRFNSNNGGVRFGIGGGEILGYYGNGLQYGSRFVAFKDDIPTITLDGTTLKITTK